MPIGYYPGCALRGSSNDYEMSVRACLGALGAELRELDDWICCGATAAHSISQKLSIALPARNLAIAERDGIGELLAPCPMCSMELLHAQAEVAANPALRNEISDIVELPIRATTRVLNLVQVLQNIGIERLKSARKRELPTIAVACYYGCLLVRPPDVLRFDDPEQPSSMEAILQAVGIRTVDWNCRTECCGAGMTMANEATVLDLSHRILSDAQAHGANAIAVACPMCHVNLDMKQADVNRHHHVVRQIPVYYLSDLVGLALGLDEATLGISRHFVPAPNPSQAEAAPSSPVPAQSAKG
jgi:heterodisulfide reductase subunit B